MRHYHAIDVTRLDHEERKLWKRFCQGDDDLTLAIVLYSYAHACMLLLSGPPDVVAEKFAELDPKRRIAETHRRAGELHRRRQGGDVS